MNVAINSNKKLQSPNPPPLSDPMAPLAIILCNHHICQIFVCPDICNILRAVKYLQQSEGGGIFARY